MYNPYNPYNAFNNPMERIDNQIKELENLKKGYQNMPQAQPIQNIINTNGSQTDFEAIILNENQSPDEILVKHKTMFFEPKKGKLSIKEINGDIVSYDVIMPKTPEQLENEELKRKINELEMKINELSAINGNGSADEENGKSTQINEPESTKDTKRVSKEK